jgi:mono/diheme cytochrome c family protein
MLPKPFIYVGVMLIIVALVPPALIAWARATTSENPRIHFVQDMDNQHKLQAQQASPEVEGTPLFRDGRAMRPPVQGTIARGEVGSDDHYHRGLIGGQWADRFPPQVSVDLDLVQRGQERFEIYCTPCHGKAGYGDGIVHQRAMQLLATPTIAKGTTWVPPKSLHEEAIREQPVGQVFNTITHGVRNMAGYGAQIQLDDRWAIVSYVKALQRSQHARPSDVPDADRLPVNTVEMSSEGDS